MITYNEIYEASRKERYSEQLQPLPKNFIQEIAGYIKEKKEISSKQDSIFSDVIIKTKKQLENAITIFHELMLRRRKKLLNLVLVAAETGISRQDFENMLPIEKELFEEMIKCIEFSNKNLDNIINGQKEEEKKNKMIVFKTDVGEFIGISGESLGPFEKGEIANLPKEIAKILIDDKKAEDVYD